MAKRKLTDTTSMVPAKAQESFGLTNIGGLAKYAASVGDDYPGDRLMLSGKTGVLSYGAQGTELPAGTRLATLLSRASFGYISWEDGRPADQAWQSLASSPEIDLTALRASLGNNDPAAWTEETLRGLPKDPYQESVRIPMVGVDGKLTGHLFCFCSSAGGAVRAVKRFVKYCLIHVRTAPTEQAEYVPVIALGITSYTIPKVGEIFEPVLDVVDWLPPQHVLHLLGKAGNASAFGLSNAQARNADLGPELVAEPDDDDDEDDDDRGVLSTGGKAAKGGKRHGRFG